MGGALGVNSLPAGSVASTARAALAGSHKTEGRGAPATACADNTCEKSEVN